MTGKRTSFWKLWINGHRPTSKAQFSLTVKKGFWLARCRLPSWRLFYKIPVAIRRKPIIKKAISTTFRNRACETKPRSISPARNPIKTATRPRSECISVFGGYHARNHEPGCQRKTACQKQKSCCADKFSLDTLRARRYIATGGDQIELRPPNMPENSPTPTCQPIWPLTGRVMPKSRLTENATIATPIEAVSKPVG